MRRRAWHGLVALVSVAALAAGCSSSDSSSKVLSDADNGKLTIGLHLDEPGIGFKAVDGHLSGFDYDIAVYVANELGVSPQDITWVEAPASQRETMLSTGQVDYIVSSYTITDARKKLVSFVGPYFNAAQGILVRRTQTDITTPETLNGKKLCSVKGTTAAASFKAKYAPQTELVQYNRYTECITALFAGLVDAITTDDVVLAGYVTQYPELLKLASESFGSETYGIGIAKGDTSGRTKIATALQKMIDSGSWKSSFNANLGASGFKIPATPQITEK